MLALYAPIAIFVIMATGFAVAPLLVDRPHVKTGPRSPGNRNPRSNVELKLPSGAKLRHVTMKTAPSVGGGAVVIVFFAEDGILDFVVGKRVYSHNESYTDPDPYGPGVLYWFRTVRNPKAPGGAEFKPDLVHNRSGVGSTVLAVDLNKDGAMDIVTSTNQGTFIFWI